MEDAHICQPSVPLPDGSDVAFFGVFDGHGGELVALYCEKHYVETLLGTPAFQQGNFHQALVDVNFLIDDQLRTPQVNAVWRARR